MGISTIENINSLENKLRSNSEERMDQFIKARILKKEKINDSQFLKLSLFILNVRCEQFAIKSGEIADFIKNIQIKIKDIKLKMIHGINYLEIKNYSFLNEEISYPGDSEVPIHIFKFPKKINKLDSTGYSGNYVSIKLKVKETDLISSFNYELFDLYNNKVEIDSLENFSEDTFENEKIYLFIGFYCKKNILYKTNFSSIEVCDENSVLEKMSFSEDINKINDGDIINLKGFINDLNIEEMTVFVEDSFSHSKVKIKLNYELTKKINPNRECQFINIIKICDKTFGLTPLSDVYSNHETTIYLKVKDAEEKYYNRICIGNKNIDIDNILQEDIIKFNINSEDKNFLFEQKFVFQKISKKIDENKKEIIIVENSYDFNLEVNKGKINIYPCFLKHQGGYTYQINFQTKNQSFLPEKIKIKLPDNKSMEIDDFETFENNLKRRFTIINSIKQNFIEINYNERPFRLNESEFIDSEKNKNLKIYCIVKNKEENNIFEKSIVNNKGDSRVYAFDLSEGEPEKLKCDVNEEDRKKIDSLYESIAIKNFLVNAEERNEITKLFDNNDYKAFFSKGFNKYIFHDTKREYNLMKKLLLLFFSISLDEEDIQHLLIRLKRIFKYLNKGDYLTRIKIFIYFYQYYEEVHLTDCKIIDIYDQNNNEFSKFLPIFESFKLFFKILDNQEEKSSFYQAIHQFNGRIRKELIKNLKMYSGSIISIKDIKFELVRKISRFFFVDVRTKTNNDAFFSTSCQLVTFNVLSFMDKIDFTFEKRISAVFLFLIFHEVCGHLKTNINNQAITDSPGHYLDENLNLIYTELSDSDSGFILESILTKNIMNCRLMLSEPKTEDLLDLKLYIQENFDDLKKKVEEFSPKIIIKNPQFKYDDKKKTNIINNRDELYETKELPKSFIDKLKEVEKNLDQYNYHSLYPLFKIPKGMNEAKFKKLLEDNPVYQKYKKSCPKNGDKY